MATSLHTSPDAANSRWLPVVLLLAFALYANTLFNGFVYDDAIGILSNPYIQNFHHLKSIFTTTVFSFQGQEGFSNYYRPLLNFAYLLTHSVFGDLPFGYHLINALLHVVVVALVYFVAVELFRDPALGLLAAAIFALHPVHTEAVAWIACIADLELAVFYLLSFLLFLRLGDATGKRVVWLYVGMLASFVLALLSKEPAITFPPAAVIYEHFVRENRQHTPLRKKFMRYACLWLVAAGYLLFRATSLGGAVALLKHPEVTWLRVPLSAFALLSQYAEKLFWPWPLSVAYPFHASVRFDEPRVLAGFVVFLAAAALFFYLAKGSRAHAFALLWIFLMLAPALNARWMATYVFTERNLYLASTGFAWLLAAGILWLWRREGRPSQRTIRLSIAVAAPALALLAAGAVFTRNRDFKDDGTLYLQTLALHPDASLIHSNLGIWHWDRGWRADAERHWFLALQYDPQNAFALSNLGMDMLEQKQIPAAIVYLNDALRVRPNFSAPHLHLAQVYAAQGQRARAEAEFRRALEINPLSTNVRNEFGKFYLDEGRLPEAQVQFQASVESIPTEAAWSGLAEIFSRQNAAAQAESAWKEVTRMNPFASSAHFALGKLYFSSGRFAEAEQEFRAGLLTDPNNADALAALRDICSHTTRKP